MISDSSFVSISDLLWNLWRQKLTLNYWIRTKGFRCLGSFKASLLKVLSSSLLMTWDIASVSRFKIFLGRYFKLSRRRWKNNWRCCALTFSYWYLLFTRECLSGDFCAITCIWIRRVRCHFFLYIFHLWLEKIDVSFSNCCKLWSKWLSLSGSALRV